MAGQEEDRESSGSGPSSSGNDDLSGEQVEKLVQLQDLTGIDDLSICRALLESKNWDLESTAREQFDIPNTPPPPPNPNPLEEAPEVRNFVPERRIRQNASNASLFRILRAGFYWVTAPVFWPFKIVYNVFSGALWNIYGILGLEQHPRRPPSIASNPLQDVVAFQTSFNTEYPNHGLAFYNGTYTQALDDAKKDLKFLLAYLHCPTHQDTPRFCRNTLCSSQFADFVSNQNAILFGVGVESHEGYRVSQALRVTSFPVLAVIVLRQNRMMIVGRQEGYCDAEYLVQKFNAIVADNEAFIVAARADRAERDMNQAIRQEQDAAFQETLRQDREKERKKRELAEAKRREEEAIEEAKRSAEERKNKIRQAKIDLVSRVPNEPDKSDPDAVRIVIKLPEGQRLERRFLKAHSLKYLYFYVFCHPDSPDDFDITTNFPRKVLPCRPRRFFAEIGVDNGETNDDDEEEEPPSFEEAGIGQSTMLFVNDLEA